MIAQLSAALLAALQVAPAPQMDTTLAVAVDGRLQIQNVLSGTVRIRTWDQAKARIAVRAEAKDAVEIRYAEPVLSVRVRPEHLESDVPTDFEITIPRRMSIEASGVEMELDIEGAGGTVAASTVDGTVRVSGGRGTVALNAVEGGVTLTDTEGNIALNSVDGDVSVRRARGVISIQAVDGGISLEEIDSGNVEVNTVDGDIVYRGTLRDDGRYFLSTHDGDISLAVPEGTNARVTVSTFSGELDAAFPISVEGDVDGRRLSFTLGSGKAIVEVSTFDGLIRLVRP
ncbi:MAG: DUF4097 family beta strand repeat-containing protein [Gemmatimonadota bacterium]|nr:DUF4097 family beta strand repeat-containing protein [Gemmatimonadota bacterium]